jgi:hypothetical protein
MRRRPLSTHSGRFSPMSVFDPKQTFSSMGVAVGRTIPSRLG